MLRLSIRKELETCASEYGATRAVGLEGGGRVSSASTTNRRTMYDKVSIIPAINRSIELAEQFCARKFLRAKNNDVQCGAQCARNACGRSGETGSEKEMPPPRRTKCGLWRCPMAVCLQNSQRRSGRLVAVRYSIRQQNNAEAQAPRPTRNCRNTCKY